VPKPVPYDLVLDSRCAEAMPGKRHVLQETSPNECNDLSTLSHCNAAIQSLELLVGDPECSTLHPKCEIEGMLNCLRIARMKVFGHLVNWDEVAKG